MKWLWEHVREKKIIEKYSPKKLIALLNDIGDIEEEKVDEILNNW